MTALDRVLASIPDDGPISREEQLDLVADLLNRRYRVRAGAATPIPADVARVAAPPVEQTCPTCLLLLDEDGYCDSCGRLETNAPRRNNLSGERDAGLRRGA